MPEQELDTEQYVCRVQLLEEIAFGCKCAVLQQLKCALKDTVVSKWRLQLPTTKLKSLLSCFIAVGKSG